MTISKKYNIKINKKAKLSNFVEDFYFSLKLTSEF